MEHNEPMTEVNSPLNSKTGGLAYSITTGFYLAVSLLAGVIVGLAGLDLNSEGAKYISYLAAPVAISAGVVVTLAVRKVSFKQIFPVKCKLKYYVIAVLMIFGLLFSLGWINDVTVQFFKLFGYVPRPSESYLPDSSGWKIIPAFIVLAILPPLAEETLFRGLILNNAERGMGGIRAVLVSGFCFALFHASPEQTVYQFIAGCAFAFLAVKSRSILPSVLMHVINNGMIVILNVCGAFDSSGALILSAGADIALTIIAGISLIGSVVWLILDKTPFIKCSKNGVSGFFIYAAAGIAVLAVMWISTFFPVA